MNIDWKNAPDWANYVAMDFLFGDGYSWAWYEKEPTFIQNGLNMYWKEIPNTKSEFVETILPANSLAKRPGE